MSEACEISLEPRKKIFLSPNYTPPRFIEIIIFDFRQILIVGSSIIHNWKEYYWQLATAVCSKQTNYNMVFCIIFYIEKREKKGTSSSETYLSSNNKSDK